MKRVLLPLFAVVSLTACAGGPKGPTVIVLPGGGKSLEQFRADDSACREWAGRQPGTGSGEAAQRRYNDAYQQCMYSKGNEVPSAAPPAALTPPVPTPPSTPPGPGAPGAPPSSSFMTKMQRIQAELPAWIQRTGGQAQVAPLMQQLDQHIKAQNLQSAETVADQVLRLLDSN